MPGACFYNFSVHFIVLWVKFGVSFGLFFSGKKLENNISSISELAKRLQLRRPNMETFLNLFLLKSTKTAKTGGDYIGKTEKK